MKQFVDLIVRFFTRDQLLHDLDFLPDIFEIVREIAKDLGAEV